MTNVVCLQHVFLLYDTIYKTDDKKKLIQFVAKQDKYYHTKYNFQ